MLTEADGLHFGFQEDILLELVDLGVVCIDDFECLVDNYAYIINMTRVSARYALHEPRSSNAWRRSDASAEVRRTVFC